MHIRLGPGLAPIEVLFQDAELLALDKPAGLLTAPDRWDKARPSLMGLLKAGIARGDRWALELGAGYLANAHRLDRETSGVILLAKSRKALTHLFNQFRLRRAEKSYLALVHGSPSESPLHIREPVGARRGSPGLAAITRKHGRSAETRVVVAERFRRYSLLRAEPGTGRLHQIRVHLQWAGCPLVGDADYGGTPLLLSEIKPRYKRKEGEPERPLISRPALHAASIRIESPATGREVEISAPWPADLATAVKYLRRFAAI